MSILSDITNGLVFIHDQREIHRDLKPQNSKFNVFFPRLQNLQSSILIQVKSGRSETSEGTSKKVHSTIYARGSAGYRAPELVRESVEETIKYTNKVDMWALGCIFYEVIVLKKLFVNDLAIHLYSRQADIQHPIAQKVIDTHHSLYIIFDIIYDLLNEDPSRRPRATVVQDRLAQIATKSILIRSHDHQPHYSCFITRRRGLQCYRVFIPWFAFYPAIAMFSALLVVLEFRTLQRVILSQALAFRQASLVCTCASLELLLLSLV